MVDPKLSIKDLIRDNWIAANTSNITPSIHTGWYDYDSKHPQITVTTPSETVIGGGTSGYSGMGSDGTPSQMWDGYVMLDIWTTREATAINPKQLIFEMRKEVARIVKANYEAITDLNYIAWKGGGEIVETDQSPVVFRWTGEIGYSYLD